MEIHSIHVYKYNSRKSNQTAKHLLCSDIFLMEYES